MQEKKLDKELEKKPISTGSFLARFLKRLDVLPEVTLKKPIDFSVRIVHTIIGITILCILKNIPYFGVYHVSNTNLVLSLLSSNSKNMTEIARSALITAPIIHTVMLRTW